MVTGRDTAQQRAQLRQGRVRASRPETDRAFAETLCRPQSATQEQSVSLRDVDAELLHQRAGGQLSALQRRRLELRRTNCPCSTASCRGRNQGSAEVPVEAVSAARLCDAGGRAAEADGVVLVTGYAGRLAARSRRGFESVIAWSASIADAATTPTASVPTSAQRVARSRAGHVSWAATARASLSVTNSAAYFELSGAASPLATRSTSKARSICSRTWPDSRSSSSSTPSTMLVHAPTVPGQPSDEAAALDPQWVYPKSRLDAEIVLVRATATSRSWCSDRRHGHRPWRLGRARAADAALDKRESDRPCIPRATPPRQAFRSMLTTSAMRCALSSTGAAHCRPAGVLLGEPETPSYDSCSRLRTALITVRALARLSVRGASIKPCEEPSMARWATTTRSTSPRAARHFGWLPRHRMLTTLPATIEALKADRRDLVSQQPARVPGGVAGEGASLRRAAKRDERTARRDAGRCTVRCCGPTVVVLLGLWPARSVRSSPCDARRWLRARLPPFGDGQPAERDRAAALLVAPVRRAVAAPRYPLGAVGERRGRHSGCCSRRCCSGRERRRRIANDTLVGALVIAFAVLVPTMPGRSPIAMVPRPDMPPGWTHRPRT